MKKKYINRWLLFVPFEIRSKTFFDRKPGRESQLVCTDVNVSACQGVAAPPEISSHVHIFQDEEDATNDAVFFFLQQRSHEEKQMTVILGLELTNITCCCSSSESDDKTIWPTVSMAAAKFAWCMRRQSSLWNVTHYDSGKCIFNERLKQNPSTTRVSRILHKRTANWGV